MLSTHTHTHTLHDRCTVRHTHELAIRTRVQSIVLRRTVRCATRQRHERSSARANRRGDEFEEFDEEALMDAVRGAEAQARI